MAPEKRLIVRAARQSSWFLPSLGAPDHRGVSGLSPLGRCQGAGVRTPRPPAWELLFTFRAGYEEAVKAVSLAVLLNLASSLSPCVCLEAGDLLGAGTAPAPSTVPGWGCCRCRSVPGDV